MTKSPPARRVPWLPEGRPGEMAHRNRQFRVGDRVQRTLEWQGPHCRRDQLGTVMRLTRNWPSVQVLFDGNKTLSVYYFRFLRVVSRTV